MVSNATFNNSVISWNKKNTVYQFNIITTFFHRIYLYTILGDYYVKQNRYKLYIIVNLINL